MLASIRRLVVVLLASLACLGMAAAADKAQPPGLQPVPDQPPPLAEKPLHASPRRVRFHQSTRSNPGLLGSSFWVLKTCAVWSPPSEFTLSKAE